MVKRLAISNIRNKNNLSNELVTSARFIANQLKLLFLQTNYAKRKYHYLTKLEKYETQSNSRMAGKRA